MSQGNKEHFTDNQVEQAKKNGISENRLFFLNRKKCILKTKWHVKISIIDLIITRKKGGIKRVTKKVWSEMVSSTMNQTNLNYIREIRLELRKGRLTGKTFIYSIITYFNSRIIISCQAISKKIITTKSKLAKLLDNDCNSQPLLDIYLKPVNSPNLSKINSDGL